MHGWKIFGVFLGSLINIGYTMGAISTGSVGSCDATTGASVKVFGISTTSTSATLTWSERLRNARRLFCYGIDSPNSCAPVSSRAPGLKQQEVSGLIPNTKYSYKYYLDWADRVSSKVTGTFVTDGSSCGAKIGDPGVIGGTLLSASRDSVENVIVNLLGASSALVYSDTTDQWGGYQFQVEPGNYQLAIGHPPFGVPLLANILVESGFNSPLRDLILTNAFQLSGTVVSQGIGDSIIGAEISLLEKSNKTIIARRFTDSLGHFSFGVLADDYLVNVTYQGKSLDKPIAAKVSMNLIMPDLMFKLSTTKLQATTMSFGGNRQSQSTKVFDLKGSVLKKPSSQKGKVEFRQSGL